MICSRATKILSKGTAQAPEAYESHITMASMSTFNEGTMEFPAHFAHFSNEQITCVFVVHRQQVSAANHNYYYRKMKGRIWAALQLLEDLI